MGKNLEQQEPVLYHHQHQHQHRAKCLWGIFHHLNHYRWNTVKKRLPYRRRATPKNGAAAGDPESKATATATGSEMQEKAADIKTENTPIEAKTAESGSASKWMKSRLKSLLFTDEGSKRKGRGRHRRSSSCPTTEQTAAIIHPDSIAAHPAPKASGHHSNVHTSLASLLDPALPNIRDGQVTSKHTCDVCIAMLKMNYMKQSDGLQSFEDHTVVQDNLAYAIEPTKAASLQESKLFLKALDLLNVRKEVFLKILQHPSSSLAHQLQHDRQQGNNKLCKSRTFPSPGGDVRCLGNHTQKPEENVFSASRKKMCTDPELLDNATKHTEQNRRQGNNRYGLWHFKNIREKLRCVIKESRKEKQRIVMDGVLDKIPRGRRMPKEGSPNLNSPFGNKTDTTQMKRASSFHESAERYNQLLESCFHRETERHCRESGTPTPATTSLNKTLERFMSLPDLRSYSSEYDTSSVRTTNVGRDEREADEGQKKLRPHVTLTYTPSASEYHTLSEPNSDEILQDGFQDVGDTFEINLQDTSWVDLEKEAPPGSPVKGLNILMDLHVDSKNKAQFDYVKDVLELSGFSGIEFLESWQSAELPLNPAVFEEVEGCMLAQPDCTGNEAGGSCDHLLLFDLINDVLLEMYERSFSYWPKPLTCHSRIRRMPVGYRVLEEVWASINWLLSWSHEHEASLIEDAVSHDLSKGNNWMNLQFDAECAGLELEELILDDLLDELLYDDLLLF